MMLADAFLAVRARPCGHERLSLMLRTPPLPATHDQVGYCWQNSRSCHPKGKTVATRLSGRTCMNIQYISTSLSATRRYFSEIADHGRRDPVGADGRLLLGRPGRLANLSRAGGPSVAVRTGAPMAPATAWSRRWPPRSSCSTGSRLDRRRRLDGVGELVLSCRPAPDRVPGEGRFGKAVREQLDSLGCREVRVEPVDCKICR